MSLGIFSLFEKTTYCYRATSVRLSSVRLSSVELIYFRGNSISNKPIDHKVGLNVGCGVVHVRKTWFFEILIVGSNFIQVMIFCKYIYLGAWLWLTSPILLKNDIHIRYTMMHVWNNRFCSKLLLIPVFANLWNWRLFCKYICVHDVDWYTNPILLKIDIHVSISSSMSEIIFFSKLLLVIANLCNLPFFANTFVCMVLTDLLTRFFLAQLSDNDMVENHVPVNSRRLCLLETSTSTSRTISCLSCITADHVIMHANVCLQFMDELSAPRSCQ